MTSETIDARTRAQRPEAISLAVIESIAAQTGTSPLELPPITRAVDPSALEMLFDPAAVPPRRGWIEFTYHGFRVSITTNPDGTTDVDVANRRRSGASAREGAVRLLECIDDDSSSIDDR